MKAVQFIGLAPDQQAAGGLLHAVANFVMVLVFQALANDVMADQVAQRIEAEDELALRRRKGCG